MLVITAAVPAERGALVIKALQEVVDARKDEREACHQSVLAATSRGGTAGPAAEEDVEDIGRAQVASQGSDGAPMHAAGNNSAAAESVLAGDDFGAAAATERSPAEGASAIDGKAVPTRSEWAAARCFNGCFRGNSGQSRRQRTTVRRSPRGLQVPL